MVAENKGRASKRLARSDIAGDRLSTSRNGWFPKSRGSREKFGRVVALAHVFHLTLPPKISHVAVRQKTTLIPKSGRGLGARAVGSGSADRFKFRSVKKTFCPFTRENFQAR